MKNAVKLSLLLSLACLSGLPAISPMPAMAADDKAPAPRTLLSVSATAHNYGFGEAISQVSVKYPTPIDGRSLSPSDFSVEGKTIASASVSTSPDRVKGEACGPYVILSLSNTNPQSDKPLPAPGEQGKERPRDLPEKGSQSGSRMGPPMSSSKALPDLSFSLKQTGMVWDTKGIPYLPSDTLYTARAAEPELQGFQEGYYEDPVTGAAMPYYLYLPKGMERGKTYPLIVFIPDASADTNDTKLSLVQGNGGTIWASKEEQAKHPSMVLVLHYSKDLVDSLGMMTTDENKWTPGLTLAYDTIRHIVDTYPVDRYRIYGTGQSQGGMANIALSDRYPDLFAAQYLVACQWNVEEMAALKDKNLWILVSEGDTKAYPGMNRAVNLLQSLGAPVATSSLWDSHSDKGAWNHLTGAMLQQGSPIQYSVFAGGNHMYTWTIAYNITPIRDWLFTQTKDGTPAFASTRGLSQEEKRSLAGTYLDMGIGFYQGACRNDAKALAFFREADRLGHMKAGRWIGLLYANGKGVPRDFKKAASWYKKSTDKGDITATWLLGELYEKGEGLPQSYEKAFALYQKAAERTDIIGAPAMTRLGRLYEKGLGCPKDTAKAEELYKKAVEAGYEEAKADLARLDG
ncbi:esterase [uncultured Dialister sp.]|uniref:esterase n=1 Tax=uncultured Dialister sp. TaxID=278064 RepID=UPI00258DDB4F|nr:esterase [uncultured Dialister sp.]